MVTQRKALTAKQRDVFAFIASYHAENGTPPSYREIMANFRLASPNAVIGYVTALRRKGWLEPDGGKGLARSLMIAGLPAALTSVVVDHADRLLKGEDGHAGGVRLAGDSVRAAAGGGGRDARG